MADTEDIIQRLVLAGQTDVIRGLDSIASAAKEMFDVLAGTQAAQAGLTALAGAANQVAVAFPTAANAAKVFVAGVTEIAAVAGGAAAAFGTLTLGTEAWAKSSAQAVINMSNFAISVGTTTENMSTMIVALARAGNETNEITNQIRRLAFRVESDWPIIQKNIRHSSDLIVQDYVKVAEATVAFQQSDEKLSQQIQKDQQDIEGAQINLAKSRQEAARLNTNLAFQAKADALNVAQAELGVVDAELALKQLQGGVSQEELKQAQIQRATLAVEVAQFNLEQAIKKQREDAEDAIIKRRETALRLQQEQLAVQEKQRKLEEDEALAPARAAKARADLNEAILKQQEDQSNSIVNLKKFIDDLSSGVATTGKDLNLSTDNIIRGLIASVGPGITALKDFKGGLGDLGTTAPALFPVMDKLADVFHNTKDETLKLAVATALFGRGVSPSLVFALSKGSEALKAQREELKALGLAFTSVAEKGDQSDEAISRKFRSGLQRLATDVKIVGTQLGLLFAPAFTESFNKVAEIIEKNRSKIIEFGETIRDAVVPVFETLVRVLTGSETKDSDQWAVNLKKAILELGAAIKLVLVDLLIPALKTIKTVADDVAKSLNDAFGTSLTGTDILLGIWAARVLGVFAGIRAAAVATAAAVRGVLGLGAAGAAGAAAVGTGTGAVGAGAAAGGAAGAARLIPGVAQLAISLGVLKGLYDDVTRSARPLETATDGLEKALKSGAISADQYNAAFQRLNELGLNATKEQVQKVIQSLGQAGPAIQDAVGAPAAAKVEQAKLAVDRFGNSFLTLSSQATQVQGGVHDAFVKMGGDGTSSAETVVQAWGLTKQKIILSAQDTQAAIKAAFDSPTGRTIVPGGGLFIDVAKQLDVIKQKLTELPEGTGAVVTVIEGISQKLVKVKEAIADASFTDTSKPGDAILTDTLPKIKAVDATLTDTSQKLTEVGAAGTTAGEAVKTGMDAAAAGTQRLNDALQNSLNMLQRFIDGAKSLGSAFSRTQTESGGVGSGGGSGGGGGSGFAGGGLFRGRPGRDTNLAWLTDQEFIFSPGATSHWGVGLLHWMNSVGRARSGGIRGFEFGGLVSGLRNAMMIPTGIPAFARGGLNVVGGSGSGSGRPFVLQMADGTKFSGMTIQDTTVEALNRRAMKRKVTAMGPLPSWRK